MGRLCVNIQQYPAIQCSNMWLYENCISHLIWYCSSHAVMTTIWVYGTPDPSVTIMFDLSILRRDMPVPCDALHLLSLHVYVAACWLLLRLTDRHSWAYCSQWQPFHIKIYFLWLGDASKPKYLPVWIMYSKTSERNVSLYWPCLELIFMWSQMRVFICGPLVLWLHKGLYHFALWKWPLFPAAMSFHFRSNVNHVWHHTP